MRVLTASLTLLCACGPGPTLVPPTVVDDAALPRLSIRVAGRDRLIHVRTMGDPSAPPVLVMHGSLADARYLLMLEPLAATHFVVLWDQRGNGLSERLDSASEYTADAIVEEIDAVAEHFAQGRRFTLVGHSFGGMFAALYTSRRPERVERLALMEPGGLNGDVFGPTYSAIIHIDLLAPGLNSMFWQNEVLSPSTHERLDLRALMMLSGEQTPGYLCDPRRPPDFPVWRPGGHVDLLRSLLLQGKAAPGKFDYDFAAGLATFPRPVTVIAGSCSSIGPDYQRTWHLPLLPPGTSIITIEGAGHRFPVERPAETVEALRTFLSK